MHRPSPAQGSPAQAQPRTVLHHDREDRLINGDDRAAWPRFGRPAGDPGTLASGQHLCTLYQDQDERREMTAAVVRGGLAAGDRVMYVAPGPPEVALALLEAGGIETGRPLRLAGFRAGTVVIES